MHIVAFNMVDPVIEGGLEMKSVSSSTMYSWVEYL